jgi:hypothetical protein
MEGKSNQNPDPLNPKGSATRKSETRSLGVDVQEWYHPTAMRRQEEKSGKGASPARTPSETGKGMLTFFDPSQISLSLNSPSNQALIFHEALHGKYGLYDFALETDFGICTDQGSIQISNYLEKHVFGGTVLVCGH